jgi:cytochrome c biogenesis protein CcdA
VAPSSHSSAEKGLSVPGTALLRSPVRIWVAGGLTVAILAMAVAAGVASSPAHWGPLIFMETLSARLSGLLLLLGTKIPLGYAFVAGMIAAVNPCGFALLPAYLGLYLGDNRGGAGARRPVGRAVAVSATVTASFVLLFGLFGILARLGASAVASSLPWIGTAVGVGLIVLGGVLASGRDWNISVGPRVASRFGAAARSRGIAGYAAYGAAYGLASLGCALPVFLGVVGTSLQVHGAVAAVGQFVLYGLGMGAVLTVVTVATAWFGAGFSRWLRSAGQYSGWASAVLLWLAGAYVVYYWFTATWLL